jgi:protein tyrosine/serine phosphatase
MPVMDHLLKLSIRLGRWLAYLALSLRDPGPVVNFGVVVEGVLSRSGRPDAEALKWLADRGVKTIVNLCAEMDEAQAARGTGLRYVRLPIDDGFFPTAEQAEKFLRLSQDPSSWPIHVHCYAGAGRAGLAISLFRYALQGWSMQEAVNESRVYFPGMTSIQLTWLRSWARSHPQASSMTPQLDAREEGEISA